MSQLPTESQLEEFERCIAQAYPEICNVLVRRFSSMGEASEIQSTINEVLAEIFDRYVRGRPAPKNLGGYVHVAVRNKLIDAIRKEAEAKKVSLDDAELDGDAVREQLNLPKDPVTEEYVWRELFHAIFDRLPPKWHAVASMLMAGASPAEIGARFEQNGYVLCRYARQLICRILGERAAAGDDLARGLARDFCRRAQRAA